MPPHEPPPRKSEFLRYVIPLALMVAIVGGIAWLAQSLPRWKKLDDRPPPTPDQWDRGSETRARRWDPALYSRVQIARGEAGRVRERLALVGAGGREGEALVETPEAKGRRRDENEDEQVRPSQAGRGRSPIGRAGTPATIE